MPDPTTDELATLRAQMAELRRDLDDALERLDMRSSRCPFDDVPEYPRMEFENVAVRHGKMQIPVVIHSNPEESGVYLYDAERQVRGSFCIWPDGQARLEIRNAQGKAVVSLGEGPGGRGEVRVNDADGTTRAGMKVSEHGGALSVLNPQGAALAAVTSAEHGGAIFLCTPTLKSVVTLKAAPEGGFLTLCEPGGQLMGSFVVMSGGASLTVYGDHGAPAASLSGVGEHGGALVFFNVDGETKSVLP